MERGKITRCLAVILAVLCVCAAAGTLFRPLWFDEALTLLEFISLPDWRDIYWKYNIPNNHIVYTLSARGWAELCVTAFGGMSDFLHRLLPFACAIGSVALMYSRWRRRFGALPVFAALACLVLSTPFLIHSAALRGYMPSFLMILAAFELAGPLSRGRLRFAFPFFLLALAAVGTTPSNLLAFAAIAIFYFRPDNIRLNLRPGFLMTAILPVLAFLIFYIPIWNKLVRNAALKEGWHASGYALLNIYAAFVLTFFPIIIAAVPGMIAALRNPRHKWRSLWKFTIFLLPAAMIPFFSPYPFPRVFWCLWPLWLYLLCSGSALSLRRAASLNPLVTGGVALLTAVLWSFLVNLANPLISERLTAGYGHDDFFQPYYMDAYDPALTVKLFREHPGKVFVSFDADRYPLLYYANTAGVDTAMIVFDPPGKKLGKLDPGTLLVLSRRENPALFSQRFMLPPLAECARNGYHVIYTYPQTPQSSE